MNFILLLKMVLGRGKSWCASFRGIVGARYLVLLVMAASLEVHRRPSTTREALPSHHEPSGHSNGQWVSPAKLHGCPASEIQTGWATTRCLLGDLFLEGVSNGQGC